MADFDNATIGAALRAELALCEHIDSSRSDVNVALLTSYLAELHKWNKAYNLTAVRDPHEMITRHILDSLSVLPFIHGKAVADAGTGAGLPGIPLAVFMPENTFVLLDSVGKKIRFVEHAISRLELRNASAEQVRVERFAASLKFDSIVSRAFSSLADFTAGCGHMLADGGTLVAMKGRHPQDEINALTDAWHVTQCERVQVPNLDAERHIVCIQART